jgi:3-methyl-2-oxobutanoate hydroxymethyltransferase
MKQKKIRSILRKKGKEPIVCLTAYTKSIAQIVDKYCDIILVGDSLGMVLYGMKSTREVKIDTMILHAKAVKKSAKKSIVVFDMPYNTYKNKNLALQNAKKIIKLTKCDAVKLEGGKNMANIIKHLTKNGISVIGHVGLLPQTSTSYKVQGINYNQKKKILNDSLSVSKSGVFAVIVECVIESLAKKITNTINVPTIGIGASRHCDGQILVTEDMLGLSNFIPKFVKQYSNLNRVIEKSVKSYAMDVKMKKFPFNKNVYK